MPIGGVRSWRQGFCAELAGDLNETLATKLPLRFYFKRPIGQFFPPDVLLETVHQGSRRPAAGLYCRWLIAERSISSAPCSRIQGSGSSEDGIHPAALSAQLHHPLERGYRCACGHCPCAALAA